MTFKTMKINDVIKARECEERKKTGIEYQVQCKTGQTAVLLGLLEKTRIYSYCGRYLGSLLHSRSRPRNLMGPNMGL